MLKLEKRKSKNDEAMRALIANFLKYCIVHASLDDSDAFKKTSEWLALLTPSIFDDFQSNELRLSAWISRYHQERSVCEAELGYIDAIMPLLLNPKQYLLMMTRSLAYLEAATQKFQISLDLSKPFIETLDQTDEVRSSLFASLEDGLHLIFETICREILNERDFQRLFKGKQKLSLTQIIQAQRDLLRALSQPTRKINPWLNQLLADFLYLFEILLTISETKVAKELKLLLDCKGLQLNDVAEDFFFSQKQSLDARIARALSIPQSLSKVTESLRIKLNEYQSQYTKLSNVPIVEPFEPISFVRLELERLATSYILIHCQAKWDWLQQRKDLGIFVDGRVRQMAQVYLQQKLLDDFRAELVKRLACYTFGPDIRTLDQLLTFTKPRRVQIEKEHSRLDEICTMFDNAQTDKQFSPRECQAAEASHLAIVQSLVQRDHDFIARILNVPSLTEAHLQALQDTRIPLASAIDAEGNTFWHFLVLSALPFREICKSRVALELLTVNDNGVSPLDLLLSQDASRFVYAVSCIQQQPSWFERFKKPFVPPDVHPKHLELISCFELFYKLLFNVFNDIALPSAQTRSFTRKVLDQFFGQSSKFGVNSSEVRQVLSIWLKYFKAMIHTLDHLEPSHFILETDKLAKNKDPRLQSLRKEASKIRSEIHKIFPILQACTALKSIQFSRREQMLRIEIGDLSEENGALRSELSRLQTDLRLQASPGCHTSTLVVTNSPGNQTDAQARERQERGRISNMLSPYFGRSSRFFPGLSSHGKTAEEEVRDICWLADSDATEGGQEKPEGNSATQSAGLFASSVELAVVQVESASFSQTQRLES